MKPDFWSNKSKAENSLKQKKIYEDLIENYENSIKEFDEFKDLYNLALEENNDTVLKETETNILNLYKKYKNHQIQLKIF